MIASTPQHAGSRKPPQNITDEDVRAAHAIVAQIQALMQCSGWQFALERLNHEIDELSASILDDFTLPPDELEAKRQQRRALKNYLASLNQAFATAQKTIEARRAADAAQRNTFYQPPPNGPAPDVTEILSAARQPKPLPSAADLLREAQQQFSPFAGPIANTPPPPES